MITQIYLKSILHYDPDSGLFKNKVWRSSRSLPGQIIGTVDGKGYLHTIINQKIYRLHRLAWLYVEGYIPKYVDHINRDRTDNRWLNLRGANCTQNAGNSGIHKHNTSGYRGVSLNKKSGKWHAQIKINGKQTYLGRFDTPEEASLTYNKAAKEHFGAFATINP
jgi:hypothetical protein